MRVSFRSARLLGVLLAGLALAGTAGASHVNTIEVDGVISAATADFIENAIAKSEEEGARAALAWADALMVEYHLDDHSHEPVIAEAAEAGVGIVVKKGLASGHLGAEEAVRFVLGTPGVGSLVVGSLSLDHLRDNVRAAADACRERAGAWRATSSGERTAFLEAWSGELATREDDLVPLAVVGRDLPDVVSGPQAPHRS